MKVTASQDSKETEEEEASDQGNRIRKRRKRAPIKGSWRRYSKGQSLVSGFFFLVSLSSALLSLSYNQIQQNTATQGWEDIQEMYLGIYRLEKEDVN